MYACLWVWPPEGNGFENGHNLLCSAIFSVFCVIMHSYIQAWFLFSRFNDTMLLSFPRYDCCDDSSVVSRDMPCVTRVSFSIAVIALGFFSFE